MIEFLQKCSVALARRMYFLHKPCFKKLGRRSVIYKPIMIRGRKNISMGDYCFFFTGARIELINKYGNQKFSPSLKIEDNTTFEQRAHITCADEIKIGHNCTFSANVYVSDVDHDISNLPDEGIKNGLITNKVRIGKNCFIGMGSFILAGTNLGNGVVVGANSVVKGEFPDNVMIAGSPAKIVKRYDTSLKKWVSEHSEI